MRRMMLYNTKTRRWEWFTIHYVRMPWEGARTRLRWLLRFVRRHSHTLPHYETVYVFDPDTLNMRDPERERRQRRRDRRDRMFAKAANALNSMIDIQKFIK